MEKILHGAKPGCLPPGAGGDDMLKVKTFGAELQPPKTMDELDELDEMVNRFISDNKVLDVISVSDMATTDDDGRTIGLIRVMCYEEKG
jgi:hypothetical protein